MKWQDQAVQKTKKKDCANAVKNMSVGVGRLKYASKYI